MSTQELACGCGCSGVEHDDERLLVAISEATGLQVRAVRARLEGARSLTESPVSSRLAKTSTRVQRAALKDDFFKARGVWQAQGLSIEAGIDPWTQKPVRSGGRAALRRKAAKQLEERLHDSVERHWDTGYRRGFRSRFGRAAPPKLPASFVAKVERQKRFATGFADDIVAGIPQRKGRMSFGPRAQLYSNSVTGSFQYGSVHAGPKDEKIFWRLGATDHCTDCPVLAISGPYTSVTLPTVPGGGETECRMNCACWLEYLGGTAPKSTAKRPPKVDQELKPPTPPGTRAPTDPELMALRDLEARMNYARRKIAETAGTPQQAQWIQARRNANRKLIDLQEKMNVSKPPTYSVPEVVRGADVSQLDVREFTRVRGIDGRTVRKASPKKFEKAIDKFEEQIVAEMPKPPPTMTPGEVPSVAEIEQLLIRQGAPAELFPAAADAVAAADAAAGADIVVTGTGVPGAPPRESSTQSKSGLTFSREATVQSRNGPTSSGEGEKEAAADATLNLLGWGAAATAAILIAALRELAAADYSIEVGIVDDAGELVYALGTWITGAEGEVSRFINALKMRLPAAQQPAVAIWSAGVE